MARLKLDTLTTTAISLTAIGGVNWGLVALDFNLVEWLAETTGVALQSTVYGLVGLSALYTAFVVYDAL